MLEAEPADLLATQCVAKPSSAVLSFELSCSAVIPAVSMLL